MSADISGFTALSERLARLGREGAETLTNLLNECFGRMIEAVHDEGGDILKFGGDALLILFSGPDHANRACRTTAEMRTIVARPLTGRGAGRVRLGISQGVHSGTFTIYSLPVGHTDLVVTGTGATETVECESDAMAGEILLSRAAGSWLPDEVLADRTRSRPPPPGAATAGGASIAPSARTHDAERRRDAIHSGRASARKFWSVRPQSIATSPSRS